MEGSGQPPPPPSGQSLPPPQPGGQPPQQPYAPQAPKPAIDSSLLRPKKRSYWLSVIPFLVGLAVMTVLIVLAVKGFPEAPDQFEAPGGPTLRLEKGEKKTIYRPGGLGIESTAPECQVIDTANERPLELDEAGSSTFNPGGDEWAAQYHFEAPSAGSYRIKCSTTTGLQRLALGDRVAFASFGLAIAGAILTPLLGFLISVVMAIVVAVRRGRHKKRLQDQAASA